MTKIDVISNTDDLTEFLVDWHRFSKKWRTSHVAKLFGVSRQALYQRIDNYEKMHKKL